MVTVMLGEITGKRRTDLASASADNLQAELKGETFDEKEARETKL